MRFAAASEVQAVRHGGAVLAFPVAFPVKAVSSFDTFPVDLKWVAVPPPLLELPLSFGVGGSTATEAGLRLSVVLKEVLAGPVFVGALLRGRWTGP